VIKAKKEPKIKPMLIVVLIISKEYCFENKIKIPARIRMKP
jgi:hypothetical protein